MAEQERTQMTIWRMSSACWITESTDTHSEYGVPIEFPLQQWLHECASMLRYAYAVCIVDNDRPKPTEHNTEDHTQSQTKTVLKPPSEYFRAARLQTRWL
jgi:hypothetical protein